MTPEQLKASILQYAIQGKLVEQRPEEGTGEELYQQIQAEKQRLIKEGKLKKEKPLPEITEDEIPFDIPDSWKWCRLRDYCSDVFSGKSPVYVKHETEYRIVGQAANQQSGLDFTQVKYTNEEFWRTMDERYFLKENDVLLNTLGNGTLGRSGIVINLPHSLLTDGHLFVFRFDGEVQAKYFYFYLQFRRTEIEKNANGSTNQTFLSLGKTTAWLVPIPPLAEQKRIVAKIEELLPYIDRYAAAYEKLEQFNAKFPEDMKKSILQYAIQGKLVEQRPEEGTGEELYQQIQADFQQEEAQPKRRSKRTTPVIIAEQEPSFDIPETWKWVKLGELGYTNIGLTYSPKDVCKDGIVVLRSSNIQNGKMDYEDIVKVSCPIPDNKMCHIGDILICARNGSKRLVGKAAFVDQEGMSFGAFMAVFRSVCNPYILHVINSAYFRNTLLGDTGTTTINQITQDMLKNVLIPLPPLAEQKRIVAKLEEILPLCERLK